MGTLTVGASGTSRIVPATPDDPNARGDYEPERLAAQARAATTSQGSAAATSEAALVDASGLATMNTNSKR